MAESSSSPHDSSASRRVEAVGVLTAAGVAIWGVGHWTAVAAGLSEIPRVTGQSPPLTAAALALLSSAAMILVAAPQQPVLRRTAVGAAAAAVALAVLHGTAAVIDLPLFWEEQLLTRLGFGAERAPARMAAHPALLVALASFRVLVSLTPLAARLWLRIASGVGVFLGTLQATGVLLGYLLGAPFFHLGGAAPMALPSAVALWALLVALFMPVLREYVAARPPSSLPAGQERRAGSWRLVLTIVGATTVLIVLAFVGMLRVQLRALEQAVLDELAAICDLKVGQLAAWYAERQRDARFLAHSPALQHVFPRLLASPPDPAAQHELRQLLGAIRENHPGADLAIYDADAVPRLWIPETRPPGDRLRAGVRRALANPGEPEGFLHGDPRDPGASLDMVATFGPRVGQARGAITIRTDAHAALHGVLQTWPVPHTTAGTILVHGEDWRGRSLSQIVQHAAEVHRLRLREPVARTAADSTATEIRHGVDARGTPVLAAVRLVPGTPWGVIAKLDEAEIVAPVRGPAVLIGFSGLALVCMVLAAGEMSWRRRNAVALAQEIDAERRHREVAERLALITRYGSDIIILADLDGRLVEVNERAVSAYGYTRAELVALRQVDLRAPAARPALTADTLRSDAAGGRVFETLHQRKDGSVFPVEISQRRVRIGAQDYRLAFIRDASERVHETAERRKLETQLECTQRLESLGILAGGVAHDFNNILMAILGRANLMRLELPADSSVRADLLEIERAAERAAELCRQMLTYAGKGHFVPEPVRLSELVREMAALLEVSIPKRITFELHLATGLPAIEGAATQLRQVIMNLVINAAEAIEGPGAIRLTTDVLECDQAYLRRDSPIEPPAPGRYVFVEVADSGAGMDAATQARIFDPFFTTKTTGRGLGLSTLLGIVRQHHGSLKLVSTPGVGTTFRVLLPVAATPTELPPAAPARAPAPWRGTGTILLVDDEEGVRQVGAAMLRRLGFEVLVAADGVEGVALFAEHSASIVGVVLDCAMPRLGGREAFARIRRLQPEVPVLFVSGNYADVADAEPPRCAFLHKPYQIEVFTDALRRLLTTDPPARVPPPRPSSSLVAGNQGDT